jgi:hypothetical protein
MDEKTEELRDIFLDVADDETVTESQEAARGSVADTGETDSERLAATIDEMCEKFEFETDLSPTQLQRLVEAFYEGSDDDAIAETLSVPPETVFEARMDLHLVRDEDPPDASVDEETWETVRERTGDEPEQLAVDLDIDETDVEQLLAVVRANGRSRRVSNRFRTTFEECLTDADLSTQLAAETQRDGLDDATEDAEVDVDF